MALKLKHEKMIPAIALDRVHVISWLQTEGIKPPHTTSIQAKVILYGHDENGKRVFDPDGAQLIHIKDYDKVQEEVLTVSTPEEQYRLGQMHLAYLEALAFIIQLNTDYGELEK